MPKRYARKKGTQRRRRRRQIVLRKSPMPLQFATKLRYSGAFTLDGATAGIVDAHVFNAGGLYDPDVSGTGHQPRGFDQLIAMYDHFVVIGSKIHVELANASTETVNQLCGVSLRDGSSVDTSPEDYMENGTVRSRIMTSAGGNTDRTTFSLTYSPKKFLGRSHPMSDPNLKGSSSADPAESAFYHIWTSGMNAGNPTTITGNCIIDYLVVFIEPKDVAMS